MSTRSEKFKRDLGKLLAEYGAEICLEADDEFAYNSTEHIEVHLPWTPEDPDCTIYLGRWCDKDTV